MIGVTPRPGGMSPCTLPSQSETCTCPIIPVSTATSSNDAPERCRCETSAFAFTAGWSTRRIRSASSWTLLATACLNGSSSIASSIPCGSACSASSRRFSATSPKISLLREHLQVAVVLADDEQHVPAAEVGLLVDVRLAAVEREAAHGRHEVDEAERDADGGADRQPELLAGLLDLRGARRRSSSAGPRRRRSCRSRSPSSSRSPPAPPARFRARPSRSARARGRAPSAGDVRGAGAGRGRPFRTGGRAPSRSGCDPPGAGR